MLWIWFKIRFYLPIYLSAPFSAQNEVILYGFVNNKKQYSTEV